MEIIIISIVVLLILAFIIRILKDKFDQAEYKYKSREYLLSKAEQNFFNQLLQNIPENLYVQSKIRLFDVIKPNVSGRNFIMLRNKIISRHLDFIIIEKSSSKIVMAIELDDSSHLSVKVQDRDKFKDIALKSAGIRLVRIKTSSNYDFSFLTETLGNTTT